MISQIETSASLSSLVNVTVDKLVIEEVRNCFITRSSLVMTWRGVDSSCLFQNLPWKNWFWMNAVGLLSVLKNRATRLNDDENYYFVFNPWSNGYHHWLAEVAVKFLLFETELRRGKILVSKRAPAFVRDFLNLFAFDNIEWFDENAFAKRLKVVTNQNSGHFDKTQMALLREAFFLRTGIKSNSPDRRIYLSRRSANARKVVNEQEVVDILTRYGFECVELEGATLRDQVELFSRTKYFISIHGAGLTNAIFMPPEGKVLELYTRFDDEATQLNACYKRLCDALGQNHDFLFCDPGKNTKNVDYLCDDIKVDIEELRRRLDDSNL